MIGILSGIQSKQSRLFIEVGLAIRHAVLIKLEGKQRGRKVLLGDSLRLG